MSRRGSQLGRLLLAAVCAVSLASAAERPDFPTRILPILTKAGCNAGACHGAATGQGGFRLSLLGYDPEQDLASLTRELGGRRLDLEAPAESLFYRKGIGELDHEGGRRLKRDSGVRGTLLAWIAGGAQFGPADLRVTHLQVEPEDTLLGGPGATVQLRVVADLSDGRNEDVTALALYSASDDALAEVGSTGLVTARDRGLSSIMIRYSGQAVAARIAVPFGNVAVADADFTPRNFIDDHVAAELRRLHLPPSPLSDDAEFFRRVHIDLIGRLPEPEEIQKFGREPASDEKRRQAIAALLTREEFVDFWTLRFGDWLLINEKRGGETRARAYSAWVRDQIAHNRPLDEFVRDLLVSQGDLERNGPANFFSLAGDPRDLGEQVSSIFLGTKIACARCHAHPADRWTQDDYYAFASFFARISTQGGILKVGADGEVEHPKTHKPVAPCVLGAARAALPPLREEADRRLELAAWLTARENPFFSRNLVNRIWKDLLGRGLVEPVDDLRPTNPAAIPALLDALAAQFAQHNFDLHWLIGEIATSRTYQLTTRTTSANRHDDRLCSHALLKPLPAQVFADAVAQVTGIADKYADQPDGTRAVQLMGAQSPSYALDVLGRCPRERSCETPGQAGGGLAQSLHLINGSTINAKLRGGTLAHLLAGHSSDTELITELYLRALSRNPTATEQSVWTPLLAEAPDRTMAAEDLLWTLLNSREFAFNH